MYEQHTLRFRFGQRVTRARSKKQHIVLRANDNFAVLACYPKHSHPATEFTDATDDMPTCPACEKQFSKLVA